MRAVMAFALIVSLSSACDDAGQPATTAIGPAREVTAENVEAERACAEITGFSRERASVDMTLREKEFTACVAAVLSGNKPALRGRADDATTP